MVLKKHSAGILGEIKDIVNGRILGRKDEQFSETIFLLEGEFPKGISGRTPGQSAREILREFLVQLLNRLVWKQKAIFDIMPKKISEEIYQK